MRLEEAKAHFNQLIQHQRLTHAYLLTGTDTLAKKEVMKNILQALVCEQKDADGRACLSCRQCKRVEMDQFADRVTFKPDGRYIRVDQVRELKEWLGTSPLEADFKLAIIEQAEWMNAAAANALLLFLEEPTDNVYLFLWASQADQLLATILSRVQEVMIEGPEEADRLTEMQQKGLSPQHSQAILALAGNRQTEVLAQYEAEEFEAWLKALEAFYLRLMGKDPQAFVLIQQQLKNFLSFQQAQDGLDYLAWLNSQILLKKFKHQSTTTQTCEQRIQSICHRLNPSIPLQIFFDMQTSLMTSKELLLANVTPQLAYEHLAIELCQWEG